MTPSPDLVALRAAAQREIGRHADRQLPGTWRLVRLYDCCPQPWIRVGVLRVADLLRALLNQPAPAPAPPRPGRSR